MTARSQNALLRGCAGTSSSGEIGGCPRASRVVARVQPRCINTIVFGVRQLTPAMTPNQPGNGCNRSSLVELRDGAELKFPGESFDALKGYAGVVWLWIVH